MFTRQWSTSERKYEIIVDRDVKVRMPDGTHLDGNIFRPDSDEKFPSSSARMRTTRIYSRRRCSLSVSRRCAATWKAATRLSSRAAVTSTRFSTSAAPAIQKASIN